MDWYLTDPLDSKTRKKKEKLEHEERSRGWSVAIVLFVAGVLELFAVLVAVSVAVAVAFAVCIVERRRELWRGRVTAVVGRTTVSRPAASGGEVVSTRSVIGRRGAEARAVLASSVASTAATVSGPAGVTVVVFVGVSQVSGVGTAVCRASVVSGSGGAAVVRPPVSGTAVSRWPRGSSVMRPSVSRGPREIWTYGAPVVWPAVSLTVGASRTTEGCVCRASVVRAGLTESGNAVRGASVCRRSVESRTAVVCGTGVV